MALAESMEPGKRRKTLALILAGIVILAAPVGLYLLMIKKSYEPLLTDIDERQAAALAEALGQQGIDYHYTPESQTLQVNTEQVHQARMALVSSGDISSTATGFELFDEAGYGMTGFTQKVNFQRALQGELERTISSLDGIRMARVHLVLPEQSLFRDQQGEASGSVVLMLKPGNSPSAQQITSIQQLVAAAVPGLAPEDIVISNSSGQVLSAANNSTTEMTGQLGYKQSVEQYYVDKLTGLMAQIVGSGKVAVAVDARIDFTQYSTQRESALTQPDGSGILMKSRTVTEFEQDAQEQQKKTPKVVKESVEQDFQTGKEMVRMEQQPGVISSLHVSVWVSTPLSEQETAQMESLVRSAAGLNDERGDTLALSMMPAKVVATSELTAALPAVTSVPSQPLTSTTSDLSTSNTGMLSANLQSLVAYSLFALFALSGLGFWLYARSRRLPLEERELLLADMRVWLNAEEKQYGAHQ